MNDHCCQEMKVFTDDPRVQIIYSPRVRKYYIPLKFQSAVQGIRYCPWCGKKLPAGLSEKFDEVLEKEYNIDCYIDAEESGTLPEEFNTDEWWKKRGL